MNTEGLDKNDIKDKDFHSQTVKYDDSVAEPATEGAIKSSSENILGFLLEKGAPGLTICVSKQNQILWQTAFGYCDVENLLVCHPDAQLRIASISKSLFAATVVAPQVEKGHLTLDSSIHKYLTQAEFPKLKYKDEERDITIEQLLSHRSGIKHYGSKDGYSMRPIGSPGSKKVYQTDEQYNRDGFYQRKTYRNVIDALEPIKGSSLVAEPGKFHYTTYGYTLLSAAMQNLLQSNGISEQIEDYWLKTLRHDWGMKNTYLDQDELIIPRRAKYYLRGGHNGELHNAPYTDSSIKWAGGGLVSTCRDLVKFANSLLDCYKARDDSLLKQKTIELFWREKTEPSYALGFDIDYHNQHLMVFHTGLANGSSSILLIYPDSEVVVAILTNLGNLNLKPLAVSIANAFKDVELKTNK